MKARLLSLMLILAMPGLALATNRHDAELALTEARSAVEAAERAGAAQSAPNEMNAARNGLASAAGHVERRDWKDSMLASERTRADAHVAEARSRQVRAEATTSEVEAAVQTLRNELGHPGERK